MIRVDPTLDIYTILLLIGLAQGVFLTYFFLINRRTYPANRYLGYLILILTLSLAEIFLNYSGLMLSVLPIYNFSEPLQFLIGPLFYCYIRTYAGKSLPRTAFLHVVPFVLYAGYMMIEYSLPVEQKYNSYIDIYHPEMPLLELSGYGNHDPWRIKPFVTSVGILLHLSFYLLLSLWVLRQAITEKFRTLFKSGKTAKRSRWLINFLLITILGILLFPVSKYSFKVATGENVMGVYITFFIYLIGYSIIRRSPFFGERMEKKYHTSTLTEAWMQQKIKQLNALMKEEKPYLKNTFSRTDLAAKLSISDHQLSQLINVMTETNFFGLINRYRTLEAKKLLDDIDHDHLTVEQIAYDVGYNSKSAFYTAFKKEYNCTPHAYRKRRFKA